jgi:RelE toxin of RelE / RelB toxin-antitoxin system
MRIFKIKSFSKWAKSEGMSDAALQAAVHEMVQGLIDADLGGGILKSASPCRVWASAAVPEHDSPPITATVGYFY